MFDYFKKIKHFGQDEKPEEEPTGKPKKDKVFIGILIVFGVIILISLITGITNLGGVTEPQTMNYGFKFNISDGIILGGVTVAYIITRIRKGRK